MAVLRSRQFASDPKLEACAVSDPAHIVQGATGAHVGKIQAALTQSGCVIAAAEMAAQRYGASTARAVVEFKRQRNILNFAGRLDDIVGKKTIRALDDFLASSSPGPTPPVPTPPPPPAPPPGPPQVFTTHDVRLFGWRPPGAVLEVNGDTPLSWVIDTVAARGRAAGGNLTWKIMAHGLPGFVQFARGVLQHPTIAAAIVDPAKKNLYIGPGKGGISVGDVHQFARLRGLVKRIEFHSCLVARMGPCPEASGHTCYDGNSFCFQMAQASGAEIVASIHLQYYRLGSSPTHGMDFGNWNGRVFTWGPAGNVISMHNYPYTDY